MRPKIIFFLFLITIGIGSVLFSFNTKNVSQVNIFESNSNERTKWISKDLISLNNKTLSQQLNAIEKEIVVLKNNKNILPLGNLNRKILHLHLGGNADEFIATSKLFTDFSERIFIKKSDFSNNINTIEKADLVIVSVHADNIGSDKNEINREYAKVINEVAKLTPIAVVVFGNSSFVASLDVNQIQSLIYVPENHIVAQNIASQIIFGAVSVNGKLKEEIGNQFKIGDGISLQMNGRLKFTVPEEVGISSSDLKKIDEIALYGIKLKAYPGCQIVVAVEDKIIYRKSFGTPTYNDTSTKVNNDHLYDIASVTKIAASTLLAMHLHSKQAFDLDKNLGYYLPELTAKSPYHSVLIRDMMAHQAGFTPWIAFYKKTLTDNQLNSEIYSSIKKEDFQTQVANGIYIKDDYSNVMFDEILKTAIGSKKYEYSDLCFYFVQKIVEKQLNEKQNTYLMNTIFKPIGLRNILYLPLEIFPKNRIIPTVDEKTFRNQLLHGYVHDQGAAMLGGVAGHAGIFSNATDLASVMQLILNKGNYAGFSFFDTKTFEEFTRQQFTGNKRGAGFDRPNATGGGTCAKSASQQSFGHSGFTGTLAWADPKDKVVFVFLSNRVHPDPENWKLRDLHIRTEIQQVVYDALAKRKKN